MAWNKPLPHPTEISAPYWEGLKAHEVRIQQCDRGHSLFFPRTHCPTCGSRTLKWSKVSGEGTLYSFTVARIPTMPEFTDEMPQALAVVELREGVRINTTMVGVDPDALKVGMEVRAVFDERPGEVTLLRFTAHGGSHPSVIKADAVAGAAVVEQAVAAKRKISVKDIEAMKSLVSEEYSPWSNEFTVSQEVINEFARLSGDDYWIHTDPAQAREKSPFGTTIAHGALVQVLASQLRIPLDYEVVDFNNMVNYGSDRLRFPSPVPSGCKIRARARIKAVEQVKSGVQTTMELNIHVVGQDRPAVINDLVILYM
ncbi:OB-fold domain-containing protein [Comamonas testosteroni]|uniref:bifunctional OB-fold nucleic acid binding domain-containing protein/MaoC family dehydratase n=1 Tax=Comamonas testosteroni TaxID=285 RepID=UPI00265FCD36|nr:OB-fold domain-containing protein [Comamonas testosteroni]WKL16895.1 OB-fold domain-containing protein [Comamonas testosteroni]WQD44610.1 OB-fold domain-containing protein [Comamonas testosteroni]